MREGGRERERERELERVIGPRVAIRAALALILINLLTCPGTAPVPGARREKLPLQEHAHAAP